jgi:hypothetical protein
VKYYQPMMKSYEPLTPCEQDRVQHPAGSSVGA